MKDIILNGANEGNLKNVNLEIPRNKLTVLTGLSGSGKTTLAVDVIFQECQRQYLEAMGLQGIRKPKVDYIKNLSPAILISQYEANRNPRSTVGTLTDIYTGLRMIFEKLGKRTCPYCGENISSDECREETEKKDGNFKVYMYCNRCGQKMDKLTRTHFSFNTEEGACKTCKGIGKLLTVNRKTTVNEALSLKDGAVGFWDRLFSEYQSNALLSAFSHYGIPADADTPVAEYSGTQKAIFYYGVESAEVKSLFPNIKPPKTVSGGKFEGVETALMRKVQESGGDLNKFKDYFDYEVCPDCNGELLNSDARRVTVNETRLPELAEMPLEELYTRLGHLEASISASSLKLVEDYLLDSKTKINRIINVGLGYLSPERRAITLSGGEMRRLKLAAALDSDLTGIIYIMDEPTIGLHPKDTAGLINVMKKLRDMDNTIIVIEHDIDVMREADFIADVGPGSGRHGGEIIAAGTLDEILSNEVSITGNYLNRQKKHKKNLRMADGWIYIKNVCLHNLKNVEASFPAGCLTAVTGVSGSGKSSLVFGALGGGKGDITGAAGFDIIQIEQSSIAKSKRSNAATYTEVYTDIRKLFSGLKDAKAEGLSAGDFSFNTKGGRCENCEGLGFVENNMLFFTNTEVTCPVCGGNRFNEKVLSIKYNGYSITDILKTPIEDAVVIFKEHSNIINTLNLLNEVGLGYLELGQPLTTLSGGECQRLKLARELITNKGKKKLYLMDEPTTGLHPADIENFIILLNKIIDAGNTVIVVEHNLQIIEVADWIVDLGPDGGEKGGLIMFAGTPAELIQNGTTYTAQYLRLFSNVN